MYVFPPTGFPIKDARFQKRLKSTFLISLPHLRNFSILRNWRFFENSVQLQIPGVDIWGNGNRNRWKTNMP